MGIYLAEFKANHIKVFGYDGAPAALTGSALGDKIKLHDLCRPLKLNRRFDLGLCLEVAEHLEASCAKTLIDTLTNLSDTIIFTAATPGQGPKSIGHINEQMPAYWLKLFTQKNFKLNKKLTAKIKREMRKAKIVWWLTKNLMVFEKHAKQKIKNPNGRGRSRAAG